MNVYIVYKWDESKDNFTIEGVYDEKDSAIAACLNRYYCYNSRPLELNRQYSDAQDLDPKWIYPVND